MQLPGPHWRAEGRGGALLTFRGCWLVQAPLVVGRAGKEGECEAESLRVRGGRSMKGGEASGMFVVGRF